MGEEATEQLRLRVEALGTQQVGMIGLLERIQKDVALLGHFVYIPNGGNSPILVQLPLMHTQLDGLQVEQTRLGLLLTTDAMQKAQRKLTLVVSMIALVGGLLGATVAPVLTALLAPKVPPITAPAPPPPRMPQ